MGTSGTHILDKPVCAPSAVMYSNGEAQVIELEVPDIIAGSISVCTEGAEVIFRGKSPDRDFYRRIAMRYPAQTTELRTALHDGKFQIRVPNPTARA